MQDKVTIEYVRGDILEVRTVWEDTEANDLITSGEWIVMHAGCAHRDNMGFQAKPVYIMAKIRTN